jgi:hypothetical protein
LPQPCPLCGRTDGTYQYVIFNHKYTSSRQALICRIGHYDVNYYLSRKIGKESSTIHRKIKRPYGKIWHSFKVQPIFIVTQGGKRVNISKYFDSLKEDKRRGKKSLTIKPEPCMSAYIKKTGWHMIPEEWLYYGKRRKVKEYPFPMLLS